MSESAPYTRHHPRWLRTRVSTYWWLQRRSYFAFIVRELSSLAVAWFVFYLLVLIRAVSLGSTNYDQFLAWSKNPFVLLLNGVSLVLVVFHAITWFNLAPQAIVIRVKGQRIPGFLIAASNYAAWVGASAVVAWLLLRR